MDPKSIGFRHLSYPDMGRWAAECLLNISTFSFDLFLQLTVDCALHFDVDVCSFYSFYTFMANHVGHDADKNVDFQPQQLVERFYFGDKSIVIMQNMPVERDSFASGWPILCV